MAKWLANFSTDKMLYDALYILFWLQEIVTRLGRWIDFGNDYKTLYPWFMESIW